MVSFVLCLYGAQYTLFPYVLQILYTKIFSLKTKR